MPVQVGALLETLATNATSVRPFARMSSKMGFEVGVLSEPLLANFTFKRLFP